MNKATKTVAMAFSGVLVAGVVVCSVSQGESKKPEETAIKDAQQLDLYAASLFHDRLETITRATFLSVRYSGRLGDTLQPVGLRHNPRVHDQDLTWSVCKYSEKEEVQPILFYIHVSLKKVPDVVATCNVNNRMLHLRVSFPSEKTTLDTLVGNFTTDGKQLTIRKLMTLVEAGE